jgi:magnesium transporter
MVYLYIVDDRERLVGVVSLRELLAAEDRATLEALMTSPVRSVTPDAPLDEVAETIAKYDLLALPVTDPEGIITGLITIDDVMERLSPPVHGRRRRLR